MGLNCASFSPVLGLLYINSVTIMGINCINFTPKMGLNCPNIYPVMGFHGASVSPEIVLICTNSLNYEGELELRNALLKKIVSNVTAIK